MNDISGWLSSLQFLSVTLLVMEIKPRLFYQLVKILGRPRPLSICFNFNLKEPFKTEIGFFLHVVKRDLKVTLALIWSVNWRETLFHFTRYQHQDFQIMCLCLYNHDQYCLENILSSAPPLPCCFRHVSFLYTQFTWGLFDDTCISW